MRKEQRLICLLVGSVLIPVVLGTTINVGETYYTSALDGTDIVLNGGTLRSDTSDALVGNNCSITVSPSYLFCNTGYDLTMSGILSGVEELTKKGNGILTLTGNNSFSGGLIINAGTLSVQNDAALGTGAITINNAIFTVLDSFVTDNSFIINSDNSRIDIGDYDLTISGNLSAADGMMLKKDGTGTLTLLGSNSGLSELSEIRIREGVLAVQDDAALGNTIVKIKWSSSFLALDSFETDNDFALGNSATIDTSEYDLVMSGDIVDTAETAGNLTKIGTGMLTLYNNTTNITNNVNVTEGDLFLSNASLTAASVNIGDSCTLLGSGTIVGEVDIIGILAPGNSIGTLNVTGDCTLATGSEYELEVDNSGNSDLLAVTGDVTIEDGSTVKVVSTETITGNQDYTFITADSIAGTFSILDTALLQMSTNILLSSEIGYQPTEVHLVIDASRFDDNIATGTPARKGVGNGLQEIADGGGNDLTTELQSLGTADLISAYNQLSGPSLPLSHKVASNAMGQYVTTVSEHMRSVGGASNKAGNADAGDFAVGNGTDSTPDRLWSVWGKYFGDYGDRESEGSVNGYKYQTYGSSFGVDYQITQECLVGVTFGFANSRLNVSGNHDRTEIDTTYMGVYGSYETPEWYLDAIWSYGSSNYDSSRHVAFGSIAETAKGDYDGKQIAANLETGLNCHWNNMLVQPLIGFRFIHEEQDSYNESDAPLTGLHVKSSSFDSYRSLMGGKLSKQLSKQDNVNVLGHISAKWAHEFGDKNASATSNFIGYNTAFTIKDKNISPDSAIVGCGVTAVIKDNTKIHITYDATINQDLDSHMFSVGLQYCW